MITQIKFVMLSIIIENDDYRESFGTYDTFTPTKPEKEKINY